MFYTFVKRDTTEKSQHRLQMGGAVKRTFSPPFSHSIKFLLLRGITRTFIRMSSTTRWEGIEEAIFAS
jgi:hypothetical protein